MVPEREKLNSCDLIFDINIKQKMYPEEIFGTESFTDTMLILAY